MTSEQLKTNGQEGHSYNAFSGRDFYRKVDGAAIDHVKGQVSRVLNIGSGDGENIKGLIERNKLTSGFKALLLDVDRGGLEDSKRTLSNFNGKDYTRNLGFVHASADRFVLEDNPEKQNHFPIKDNWADLVIGLNVIHLLDDPQFALREAARISVKDSQLIVSSTYEKYRAKSQHPQTNRILGLILGKTIKQLEGKGYSVPRPADFARFTESDYIQMAEMAGYQDVKIFDFPTSMDRDDFKAIFSYDDFLQGAFPGVPSEVSRPLVAGEIGKDGKVVKQGNIDIVFDERNVVSCERNWMFLTGVKR